MRRKRITGLGMVLLVVLLLAGCGGGGGGDQSGDATHTASTAESPPGPTIDTRGSEKYAAVWVTLDGWEGAETVSLLMAEKRGYFEKERIAPLILSPVTPKRSIPYVVSGQNAFGVAHGPEAVVARDKGAPIVIVGSVVPQATAAFIWPKGSGIKSIADLKGKTVAIPGLASQLSFLQLLLAEAGLKPADVKVITVGNDLVPALLKGRADAIFGGSGNLEGVELRSRGVKPVVTPVADLGMPEYDELVLVARQDVAEANPKLMKDFVSAMGRGAAAAMDQPKAAAKALDVSGESNPEISDAAMRGEVIATVGKLSDSGYVDTSRVQRLIDWMFENGMIEEDFPAKELVLQP